MYKLSSLLSKICFYVILVGMYLSGIVLVVTLCTLGTVTTLDSLINAKYTFIIFESFSTLRLNKNNIFLLPPKKGKRTEYSWNRVGRTVGYNYYLFRLSLFYKYKNFINPCYFLKERGHS